MAVMEADLPGAVDGRVMAELLLALDLQRRRVEADMALLLGQAHEAGSSWTMGMPR